MIFSDRVAAAEVDVFVNSLLLAAYRLNSECYHLISIGQTLMLPSSSVWVAVELVEVHHMMNRD